MNYKTSIAVVGIILFIAALTAMFISMVYDAAKKPLPLPTPPTPLPPKEKFNVPVKEANPAYVDEYVTQSFEIGPNVPPLSGMGCGGCGGKVIFR